MNKQKTLAIANALIYGVMVFVNIALQNTEVTTASVSDKYLTLLTPSGLTFMIWILIFGLLLIFTVKELMSDEDSGVGLLYMISSLLNIAWVILWHYEMIFISLVVIMALAFVLSMIVRKLRTNNSTLTRMTFSVYYAWVSVASIISIFVFFTSLNKGAFDLPVIRLLSALTLCLLVIPLYMYKDDLAYILVYVWAIVGIIIRHINEFNSAYMEILITAFILVLVCGAFIYNYFDQKRKRVNG